MKLQDKLARGISAAQAGHKAEARKFLTEVIETDETQLEAWLWLSQLVDSLEEKVICLENVLTLDAANEFAQKELARVKSQQEAFFTPTYRPGEETPPPAVVTMPEAAKTPIVAEYPHEDEFDNEWLCPYCTALTQPEDRTCPACRRSLIISRRVKEERTVWLWRGIFLQFVIALFLFIFGLASFTVMVKLQGISNPIPFLPLYFGLSVDQPEALIQTVLTAFPLWFFWGLVGVILYSLSLMLLLYFRVPYGHFLYLVNSGMMLVLGAFGIIFLHDSLATLAPSVIGLFLGAGQLLITLNLWIDFTFEEGRLRLKVDRGAKNHPSLFISARKYSELGMWGLAVIHLRRAIAREARNPSYHAALAVAYMNIKRYDLAEKALGDAEKLAPKTIEFRRLREQLDTLVKSQT